MKVTRNIVQIDESKCDGCGICVSPCAEGAIEIIDGKAKVVKDELCDGAGLCLDVCPNGALMIIKREADEFNEKAAEARIKCFSCGSTDDSVPLLPCRRNGASVWVCTRCLPALIHG